MCTNPAALPCLLASAPAHASYCPASLQVLPTVASKKIGKGGYLVLRPDSGDPTEAVLMVRGRRGEKVNLKV